MMLLKIFNRDRIAIDLSTGAYIIFFAPPVKNIVEESFYGWSAGDAAFFLGVIIIAFNILEAMVLPVFISATMNAAGDRSSNNKTTTLILVLFLHAALSILSVYAAFMNFGINPNVSKGYMFVIMGLIFIKEIYLIFQSFSKKPKIFFSPLVSKIIITLFSCLMFTIFWDANKGMVDTANVPMLILNLIPMFIMFCFFYFTLRIPFVIYRVVNTPTLKERLIGYVSFMMVFIPAVLQKLQF